MVALCCHMALDMLCQEMRSGAAVAERPCVTARKAFLSPWTGCHKIGEGCGEIMKEKERGRRAQLSFVELASFVRKL